MAPAQAPVRAPDPTADRPGAEAAALAEVSEAAASAVVSEEAALAEVTAAASAAVVAAEAAASVAAPVADVTDLFAGDATEGAVRAAPFVMQVIFVVIFAEICRIWRQCVV